MNETLENKIKKYTPLRAVNFIPLYGIVKYASDAYALDATSQTDFGSYSNNQLLAGFASLLFYNATVIASCSIIMDIVARQ